MLTKSVSSVVIVDQSVRLKPVHSLKMAIVDILKKMRFYAVYLTILKARISRMFELWEDITTLQQKILLGL